VLSIQERRDDREAQFRPSLKPRQLSRAILRCAHGEIRAWEC
jgi:hypothetical protein